MDRDGWFPFGIVLLALQLFGCTQVQQPAIDSESVTIEFSGKRAIAIESEFVSQFPNRHSGALNNKRAAEWIRAFFDSLGWQSTFQEWDIVNYSEPVRLRNVVNVLPGRSEKKILVVAHHDQSPRTVQGADNDGSGISILLHLAEIFSDEKLPYTLVFVATDAEEYGMLGTRHYVQTVGNSDTILAGISLDNLGKELYDGIRISAIGQFRDYGALWLKRVASAAAKSHEGLWIPSIKAPVMQMLDQAVPISFMDQGPMVAADIPALGFAGIVPPEYRELHWQTYHSPKDLLEYQSPKTLAQSGGVTEALIRELMERTDFPKSTAPYLYFKKSAKVLNGIPLFLIFLAFIGLFFAGALLGKTDIQTQLKSWSRVVPHFLSLWMPLVLGIVLLYLLVALGIMDTYHLYPATSKDPAIFQPKWGAVILFLLGLTLFFIAARLFVKKYAPDSTNISWDDRKSLGLLVVGLCGIYILVINPFSLLFLVPVVGWLFIRGRKGKWRTADIALFLGGGLVVYALIYFFGFLRLHNDLAVLWYLMMMFSIGMISFPTALAITGILGAGLSMVVTPAGVLSDKHES